MTTCTEAGCTRSVGLLRLHPDPYCLHHTPLEQRPLPNSLAPLRRVPKGL